MPAKVNLSAASALVRTAAAMGERGTFDADWFKNVKTLSKLCKEGGSKTHIAFLGTAMIAKATRLDVDLLAIKPRHAKGNPNAYSARSLCEKVLVPLATDLGFSIGVTGRQPLNNQPYFRITRVGDSTPVHPRARAAFDWTVKLIEQLQPFPRKTQRSGPRGVHRGTTHTLATLRRPP